MIWQLFWTFFKIGGFTIGGGYAMLPLIEREVVAGKGWVSEEEFLDLVALAQSAPGVFAVNFALVVGYKVRGLRGAAAAVLGAILPSFFIILVIARFYRLFREMQAVEAFMTGAAPVVVALLLYAAYSMGTKVAKDRTGLLICLAALGVNLFFHYYQAARVSPITLILLGGLAGYVLYYRPERERGDREG